MMTFSNRNTVSPVHMTDCCLSGVEMLFPKRSWSDILSSLSLKLVLHYVPRFTFTEISLVRSLIKNICPSSICTFVNFILHKSIITICPELDTSASTSGYQGVKPHWIGSKVVGPSIVVRLHFQRIYFIFKRNLNACIGAK